MASRARGGSDKVESVQEGCRWLHNPPDGADFASWFQENVKLHAGLNPQDYVNGITLIPNEERVKFTRLAENGDLEISEQKRLTFNPYPQVETRVRYFWDYCAAGGFYGEVNILPATRPSPTLPAGAFVTVVQHDDKNYSWLGVKAQVRVYERDVRSGDKGRLLAAPPAATKMVPLSLSRGPDVNAPLKAETGAIGRALGFAGMLIIPGAGISTAEDMQDLAGHGSEPAASSAALPDNEQAPTGPEADAPAPDKLADTVQELTTELMAYPEVWAQVEAWAVERSLDLSNPAPAALRVLERQFSRRLAEAQAAER